MGVPSAPGVANANLAAPAPRSSGSGGGILGFLGRAVSGAKNAVVNAPQALAHFFVMDPAKAAIDVGEKGINTVAGTHLGNQFAQNTNWADPGALGTEIHSLPSAEGIFKGGQQTVRHAIGNAQMLTDFYTGGLGGGYHPLGQGYEQKLIADYKRDPTGSALNDAANLSLLAGGAGKVAGALGADGAAESLGAASHGLGKVAASPLFPVEKAGGFLADVAKKSDTVARLADAAKNYRAARGIAGAQTEAGFGPEDTFRAQRAILRDTGASKDEFAAGVLRARGETASLNGAPSLLEILARPGNESLLAQHLAEVGTTEGEAPSAAAVKLALNPTPKVEAAEAGVRKAYGLGEQQKIAGVGLPPGHSGLDRFDLTAEPNPRAVEDLTAKTRAQLGKAQAHADQMDTRALRLEAAQRTVEPALENGGIPSLLDAHEASLRANNAAENAGTRAETALNKAENARVKPTYTEAMNGQLPTDNPRNTIEMLQQAHARLAAGEEPTTPLEKALARQQAVEDRASAANEKVGDRGEKVIQTYVGRGKAAGIEEGTREGMAKLARQQADRAARLAQKIGEKLAQDTEAAKDHPDAAAAKLRTPITMARNVMDSLKSELEGGHVTDPARIQDIHDMLGDLDKYAHLKNYVGNEDKFAYVKQASPSEVAKDARGEPAPSGRAGGSSFRRASQTVFRKGVETRFTEKGQESLLRAEAGRAAHNETLKLIDQQASKTPTALLEGQDISGWNSKQIDAAMRAQGYKAWDPSTGSPTAEVPLDKVGPNTKYLPGPVLDQLAKQYVKNGSVGMGQEGGRLAGRVFDQATNLLYRDPLSILPHYAARRLISDALLTKLNGDVPLHSQIPLLARAAKAIRSGDFGPEFDQSLNDQTSRLGAFHKTMQIVPRTIDKMYKVAVELDKMDKGMPRPEAIREAGSVFSDIARMSPGERGVLARLVPSEPWMKSVAKAAIKLGRDHPASMLLFLHMGDMAAKDPNAFKTNNTVDLLNPMGIFSAGASLTNPIAKMGIAAAGLNPNKPWKPLTREAGEGQVGPVAAKHLAYVLSNQLPIGKLLHQSPAYGQDQRVAYYDTGDVRRGTKDSPIDPAYVPPTVNPRPIPGLPAVPGTWGPYWNTILGNPKSPVQTIQGLTAKAKAEAARKKSEQSYQNFVKAAIQAGLRH